MSLNDGTMFPEFWEVCNVPTLRSRCKLYDKLVYEYKAAHAA